MEVSTRGFTISHRLHTAGLSNATNLMPFSAPNDTEGTRDARESDTGGSGYFHSVLMKQMEPLSQIQAKGDNPLQLRDGNDFCVAAR